jgi:ribosomal protein L37AE/L43A
MGISGSRHHGFPFNLISIDKIACPGCGKEFEKYKVKDGIKTCPSCGHSFGKNEKDDKGEKDKNGKGKKDKKDKK